MEGISIDELRTLCSNGKIKWSIHIMNRLQERGIDPSDVKNCIQTGEIIEQYPDDFPYPSCLVFGYSLNNKPLHAVLAIGSGVISGITSYFPNMIKWDTDYKTRKVVL